MSALDPGARQLAAQARSEGVRSALLAKLARGITRGRATRVSASPPVIGMQQGTSLITPGKLYEAFQPFAPFTFLRARWEAGSGYPLYMFMLPEAVGTNVGIARNGGTAPLVRFWSDAPMLEIANRTQSGGYRLRVDGDYVSAGLIANNAATEILVYTRFDWSGVRAMRLYEVEGESNTAFGGVRVPPTSIVWPAPLCDDDLRVVVHGDSFVEAAIPVYLSQLLGQPDTRGSGLGSTGFVNPGAAGRVKFIDRVQSDVIAPAPHVVIDLGGLNDNSMIGGSAAVMQAAVAAWLDTVQAALPETLIFMTGPMYPNGLPVPDVLAVRDGKKAACAGRRGVVFIDNLAEGWVTGTGRVGAPAGDGIADWVTSSDNTHPSDEGCRYLAERVVRGIAARVGAV